jgi:hypothetical protein
MQWEPAIWLLVLLAASAGVLGYATFRGHTWLRLAAGYIAAVTAGFWVTSMPAGPVEIKDLVPYLALSLIPLLAGIGAWMSPRLRSRWTRGPVGMVASLVSICTGFLLFLVLFLQPSCIRREKPLYSPDGRHAAVIRFSTQGAVGPEGARIWVRKTWSPFAADAYVGYAALPQTGEPSPRVDWLGPSRLRIQLVNHPPDRKHVCAEQVGEITILCESVSRQ